MKSSLEFIIICLFLVLVLLFGVAVGSDRLRNEIIDTCVARNPDMANSKIKAYCQEQFDNLLDKKYAK